MKERPSWEPWAWLAAGAMLRGFRLGAPSLWADEAFTYEMTRHPVGTPADLAPLSPAIDPAHASIFSWVYNVDSHPPLYYLVMKGWLWLTWRGQAGPPPEWLLRVPSWAFTVGALWLTYCLAKRLLGAGPALWALAVLAVLQAPVWMAQDARMYALLGLLMMGGALGVVRWWQDGSWWGLGGWLVCSALGVYTHYLGALAPVAAWVWALATQRGTRWRGFAGASVVVVGACLPWWQTLLHQITAGAGPAALSPLDPGSWWTLLPQTWMILMCGFSLHLSTMEPAYWYLAAMSLTGLAAGVWALARMRAGAAWFAAAYLLVPITALSGAQWLLQHLNLYQARYFLYLSPFAALVVGPALYYFWHRRPLRIAALALGLLTASCNAAALATWYQSPALSRQPWRDAVRVLVAGGLQRGDVVLLQYPYYTYPVMYYLGRNGIPSATFAYPTQGDVASGGLAALLRPYRRAWMLSTGFWPNDPSQAVARWLEQRGPPVIGITVFGENAHANFIIACFEMRPAAPSKALP